MNREIHVRFWEGLRVRFPWATHPREDLRVVPGSRNKPFASER
jgi:hypothetical protein